MRSKPWTVEQRFPTKHAREKADAAIEALTESESMARFIDTWLAAYRAAGGIDKRNPKR